MNIKYYLGNIASGVGFWIGAVICVPLALFVISKIFFGTQNNVTENNILQYMNQSEQIEVKMPPFESELYVEDFGRKLIINFLARGGKGSNTAFYITFYNREYQKYFNIWFFSNDGVLNVRSNLWLEGGAKAYLTVNKQLMSSSEYGTKENPVPVLKVVGVEKSLRYQGQDQDEEYMKFVYHTNVEGYLGYEMSKKDFKAMFGNK